MKREERLAELNNKLSAFYETLDNERAQALVREAYYQINQGSPQANYHAIPQAMQELKRGLGTLSMRQTNYLTGQSALLWRELEPYTRQSFLQNIGLVRGYFG